MREAYLGWTNEDFLSFCQKLVLGVQNNQVTKITEKLSFLVSRDTSPSKFLIFIAKYRQSPINSLWTINFVTELFF